MTGKMFKAVVGEAEVEFDLGSMLDVHPESLTDDLTDQASNYFMVAEWRSRAYNHYLRAKVALEQMRATAIRDIRDQEEGKQGRKLTVMDVEAIALNQPVVVDAQEAMFEAEQNFSQLRDLCDALNQRRDMLVQLSSMARAELKTI